MKLVIALALALFCSFAAPRFSAAQGSNKAAAEALYQQAVKLFKAEQFGDAAEKFDASQKLDPAIGTLLYLGDCYEKLNKKASAWAAFKEAASLAQSRNDDREKTAEVRAAALLPQVSHLVVRVADVSLALPGFVLRRDGVEMPPGTLGAPLPMDAGKVELQATATGHTAWTQTVNIPDGGKEITVDVPALAPAGSTVEPSPAPVPVPTPVPPSDDGADQGGGNTGLLIAGIAVTVLGLGGMAAGSAFGLEARNARDDSLERCRTERFCTPEGVALREDAQDAATISTITFIVGGVLTAGGVTLLVLSQVMDDDSPPQALQRLELVPQAGPTTAGLTLRGAW